MHFGSPAYYMCNKKMTKFWAKIKSKTLKDAIKVLCRTMNMKMWQEQFTYMSYLSVYIISKSQKKCHSKNLVETELYPNSQFMH